MEIFIDTSAFYALLDSDDQNHKIAVMTWLSWESQDDKAVAPYQFITSNYVLLESFSLIQRRLGMVVVRQLRDNLLPICSVAWLSVGLHEIAIRKFFAADRRSLSLVDCTSFEVVRILGIHRAFTFDKHFAEQGFHCIPDF
jgi:predicted nucleic acid-binding protein